MFKPLIACKLEHVPNKQFKKNQKLFYNSLCFNKSTCFYPNSESESRCQSDYRRLNIKNIYLNNFLTFE